MSDPVESGTPDLVVTIVNYRSEDYLPGCLASIPAAVACSSVESYVVDNGSDEEKLQAVKAQFPSVNWIFPNDNIGYSAANNLVLSQTHAKYILLLNPDVILWEGAVDRLITAMDTNPDIGILGCSILYPGGVVQQGPGEGRAYAESGDQLLDWPFILGACMLIRGAALAECGPMDERLFLFNEDEEYCHRFREAGWRVCLMSGNCVTHFGGKSYAELDYMAVERQRSLSYVIYCQRCMSLGQRVWKLSNYIANAIWCSAWYSCASLGGSARRIKKKQMYLARLQALALSCSKRRRVL